MYSKEENLEKNHIKREKGRSYRRQGFRTLERDIKIEGISIRRPK